jgi:hypothetical protein
MGSAKKTSHKRPTLRNKPTKSAGSLPELDELQSDLFDLPPTPDTKHKSKSSENQTLRPKNLAILLEEAAEISDAADAQAVSDGHTSEDAKPDTETGLKIVKSKDEAVTTLNGEGVGSDDGQKESNKRSSHDSGDCLDSASQTRSKRQRKGTHEEPPATATSSRSRRTRRTTEDQENEATLETVVDTPANTKRKRPQRHIPKASESQVVNGSSVGKTAPSQKKARSNARGREMKKWEAPEVVTYNKSPLVNVHLMASQIQTFFSVHILIESRNSSKTPSRGLFSLMISKRSFSVSFPPTQILRCENQSVSIWNWMGSFQTWL